VRDPQEYLDRTPCVDGYGDRSTVGFEKLWQDVWAEVRAAQARPYHATHDIDPWHMHCRHCHRHEIDIHLEKLRCEDQLPPFLASGL
jgi:hypothetical protein